MTCNFRHNRDIYIYIFRTDILSKAGNLVTIVTQVVYGLGAQLKKFICERLL